MIGSKRNFIANHSETEYVVLHQWVRRQLGDPSLCSECGTTSARKFGWHNISGEYNKDVTDWKRLCTACHSVADGRAGICKKGHIMDDANSYFSKGRVGNTCLRCKNEYNINYYKRRKALMFPSYSDDQASEIEPEE